MPLRPFPLTGKTNSGRMLVTATLQRIACFWSARSILATILASAFPISLREASLSTFYGIVRQLLSLSQEENMTTLEKVQARIKKLQDQADALIAKESSAVLEQICDLMSEHGLTTADIDAQVGGKKRGPKTRAKAVVKATSGPAKYRDPKSGATWSGRGRAPGWIATVKDRTKFLVVGSAASSATAPASKAKAAGKYLRGPQPAKYMDAKTGATWSGRGPAPAWIANVKGPHQVLDCSFSRHGDGKEHKQDGHRQGSCHQESSGQAGRGEQISAACQTSVGRG
jgi:DNA-binding protein H-NS